jgi:hypothetical protein
MTKLAVDHDHVDDDAVAGLAKASTLAVLHLDHTDVGDASAENLAQLTALTEVTLGDTDRRGGGRRPRVAGRARHLARHRARRRGASPRSAPGPSCATSISATPT